MAKSQRDKAKQMPAAITARYKKAQAETHACHSMAPDKIYQGAGDTAAVLGMIPMRCG